MSFEFNVNADVIDGEGSYQGDLASSYTNEMTTFLQSDEGADFAAFLAHNINGLSIEDALAVKDAIMSGNFQLSGLFSAAQDKTGYVDGDDIADPTPTLTVNGIVIDLTAMLEGTDTAEWNSITTIKKTVYTTYHSREFYTDSKAPEGYASDWAAPQNEAPTADPIVLTLTEYDEHAQGADQSGAPVLETVDLLSAANAADPDSDPLSVVAGSVKIDNGDGTYSDLPSYMTFADGILSIDRNSPDFDTLYNDATLNIDIVYQITDGVNPPITNTVDLTITGTADQFHDSTTITVDKIGDPAYTETGSYTLLGFDWSGVNINVTGYGDYDRNIEGFTVTLDVDATYAGSATTGNSEDSFIAVDPSQALDANWSDDGDLDYQVTFPGAVDGYTALNPDASQVDISLSYDYWL